MDIDDLCRLVPADAIVDLDYDLSPSRHVPLDPQVPVLPLSEAVEGHKFADRRLEQISSDRRRLFELIVGTDPAEPESAGWNRATFASVLAKKISGEWGEDAPVAGEDYVRCLVIRGTDFPDVAQLRLADLPLRFVRRRVLENKKPRSGDMLVEISGGGKYQNTGRALFLPDELLMRADLAVLHTNFTKLLRIDSDKVLPKYFFYFWSMLYDLGRTARYEKQPTNIKNFKLDDFLKHEFIAYPPQMDEQARIVAALDLIQNELQAARDAQNLLLAVRHASFKELLGAIRRISEMPPGRTAGERS